MMVVPGRLVSIFYFFVLFWTELSWFNANAMYILYQEIIMKLMNAIEMDGVKVWQDDNPGPYGWLRNLISAITYGS